MPPHRLSTKKAYDTRMPLSRIVISSESEKSFSFAVRQKRRGEGERETPHSLRLGSTVFHAESFTKENGNGKRKRSLGCARDDETGEAYLTLFFNPTAEANLRLFGAPPSRGRRENAAFPIAKPFPRIVISSESEKSFSFAVRQRL